MAAGAVSGLELMERAGAGVAAAIVARWGGRAPRRAVVLCGPGNNGGDGYVVARHLHANGWEVHVHALGEPANLSGDAGANRARWTAIAPTAPMDGAKAAVATADLVVDALFGLGLSRPPDETLRDVFAAVPTGALAVAVDVPSGLAGDATDWPEPETVFPADLTVTFHAPKPAHRLLAAAKGSVVIVDIGL